MAKRTPGTQICTSVGADSLAALARKGSLAFSMGTDLVEMRVDSLTKGSTNEEVEERLSVFAERAVFTVRSRAEGGGFRGGERERLGLISRLAELSPAYLDVELATARKNEKWLRSLPRDVKIIISWHDFEATPKLDTLRSIRGEALGLGPLAKVVTTATKVEDNLTTLGLCGEAPHKVISFCMGELGTLSRVLSMRLGAPLAYASLPKEAVAPGQLSVSVMRRLRSMVA